MLDFSKDIAVTLGYQIIKKREVVLTYMNKEEMYLFFIFLFKDVMESIRLLQNASARTPTSGTVLAYLFGIITDRLMNTSFSESTLQVKI